MGVSFELEKKLADLLEAAEGLLTDALDRGECHDEDTGEMFDDWKALEQAITNATA